MNGDTGLRLSERSDNLPAELTSFIDRREVLVQAKSLLGSSRLVTMVGTGGAGKTRLAIRAAREVRSSFPDGVWFIDLSALHDPALLADAVASALRLILAPGKPALRSLADYFATQRILLVLDNCEHLLDQCAMLAGTLLRDSPELRILATSREPLGIFGESTLQVLSMGVPESRGVAVRSSTEFESVALFVERALQAYPDFVPNSDNLRMAGEICYRLDGLPLAIELAAVRLRALSIQQLLERLSDPYRLLTGGSRSAPERQRTLRSSIEWSYDLCTEQERTVWGRLSIFAGGCELDAAEGICSGDGIKDDEVLDVLQSLVEKSLVIRSERSDTVWYRMLETIREFGWQQLVESGKLPAVQQRHRDWYAQLVLRAEADWVSPRQRYWLARMYREIANLRQALEFSLGRGSDGAALELAVPAWRICWWALGRVDELRVWLDRATAQSPEPTLLRGRALLIRAYLAANSSHPEQGAQDLAEGRAVAEQVGDRLGLALAASAEAVAAKNLEETVSWFERGLEALSGGPELGRYLNLLAQLSATLDEAGELERSAEYRDRLIEISEQNGELFERSYLLLVLGVSTWSRGDLPAAEDLVTRCLRLKRELDDPVGAAMSTQTLACIAAAEGRYERAGLLLGAAHVLWHVSGAVPASFPAYLKFREDCERATRDALGDATYTNVYGRGADLDARLAIVYALGEQEESIPNHKKPSPLTSREQKIAELLAEGLTNKQIAEKLVIAVRTVEGHTERIRSKLGFSSRTQIALWVLEHPEFADA